MMKNEEGGSESKYADSNSDWAHCAVGVSLLFGWRGPLSTRSSLTPIAV